MSGHGGGRGGEGVWRRHGGLRGSGGITGPQTGMGRLHDRMPRVKPRISLASRSHLACISARLWCTAWPRGRDAHTIFSERASSVGLNVGSSSWATQSSRVRNDPGWDGMRRNGKVDGRGEIGRRCGVGGAGCWQHIAHMLRARASRSFLAYGVEVVTRTGRRSCGEAAIHKRL